MARRHLHLKGLKIDMIKVTEKGEVICSDKDGELIKLTHSQRQIILRHINGDPQLLKDLVCKSFSNDNILSDDVVIVRPDKKKKA